MIRAVLAGGVPNVVASRWDIDSVQARRFTAILYDQLFLGKTVAEAVKEAETELLKHSDTSHPYYWAAFAAFGHA
jgi:CHAT domain-containing protein